MSSGVASKADIVILSRTASVGCGIEPLGELETGRAVQDQRTRVRRVLLALPGLGLAQLVDASELRGHEVVAHEDRPHAPLTGYREQPANVVQHLVATAICARIPTCMS